MVKHKTGMAGMTGNKGCVAMHMMFDDTSICIVSAHLAAGSSNFAERNNDYHTIRTGTRFQRGRYIDSHDYVFWIGDLNYRVSLPNDQVRTLVAQGQLRTLLQHDQLKDQMAAGKVFRGYNEADVRFAPTYKYDSGTTTYDTSEKMRVPSWTDRIMYRGRNVRVLEYYRDEICFSDHKPVLAMMQFDVMSIDKAHKRQITRNLYARLHELDSGAVDGRAPRTAVQKLIDLDMPSGSGLSTGTQSPSSVSVSGLVLPNPSSDSYAWWTNTGTQRTKPAVTASVNPFSPTVAPINTNSAHGSSATSTKPPNFDADPFADDGSNIAWKPMNPS
ncbi:Inositol-1,4,5-trisphosphate 5-phosphatase 1 [Coemansia sp. RSA 678]|nr:Inositol-1,4,5-trisphosphate 5-phosphatase 1 [Coemansia sp. RSA 678]